MKIASALATLLGGNRNIALFQHAAHAEFTADLLDVGGFASVGE